MSGIGFPNNLNPETTKVLDNRCAGVSSGTNSITYPAQGLLRYETDTDNWKYYDNTNNWVNFSTGVIYTNGTGVSISPSNVISIGQSVETTDDVTFNSVTTNSVKGQDNGDLEFRTITSSVENVRMTITNTGRVGINVAASNITEDFEIDGNMQLDTGGAQRSRIIFYDKQNDHEHAEVDGLGEGTNGGALALYTKVDGGSVTEKLRINNVGAIGIGGANYGTTNQVLISNGSGSSVTWANQTDTTYTQGTGVTISPSNVISIGQSVATSDSPSFNQLSLGVAGTNQGIINLQDFTNVGTSTVAQIKGILEGTNGGKLQIFTKKDGGSLTERLSISNSGIVKIKTDSVGLQIASEDGVTEQGYIYNSSFGTKDFVIDAAAGSTTKGIVFRTNSGQDRMRIGYNGELGFGASNSSGNQYQLLQSNGSGSSPSWVDPPLSTVIVSARKNTDTNVTCNANTTTFNDVDGFTEEIDTHNAYNPSTGVFTAPRDGIYNVSYITNYNDGNDSTYFGFVANNIQVNRGSGFVIEMAQNMFDTQRGILLSTIYSHYIVTLSTGNQVKCVAQFFSSGVSTVCTIRGHATTPRCTVQNIHSLN